MNDETNLGLMKPTFSQSFWMHAYPHVQELPFVFNYHIWQTAMQKDTLIFEVKVRMCRGSGAGQDEAPGEREKGGGDGGVATAGG